MRLRFHGTRDEQIASLRVRGWQIFRFKTAPVVIAFEPPAEKGGRCAAKAWRGNAHRPSWFYTFRSEEKARAYAEEYTASVAKMVAYRADRTATERAQRTALKASDHYAIGEVLYDSWGYDQTNIDYYQVTELKPRSIVIRPIMQAYSEQCFMSGPTQPRRNEFSGEPITKPLRADGSIASKHGCFSKWTGASVWSSHYA